MAKVRIGGACAKFAVELGENRIKDWWKRRRLAEAYYNAAAETIEYCRIEGNPTGSVIWNAVADFLGAEARARQIASWYAHGVIEATEFQVMIGTDEKVGRFLNYFVGQLNRQRAGLLPALPKL